MSQAEAWKIIIYLQPLLGSLFMYLYIRQIGLSKLSAIFSSIIFNFSQFASVWLEYSTVWHTILWLPLLLYLIERYIQKKRLTLYESISLVSAVVFTITAGHPQDALTVIGYYILYLLVRILTLKNFSLKKRCMIIINPFLSYLCVALLISALQILPTVELLQNSARTAHSYSFIIERILVQWWQIPLILVQDFFGNPATKTLMMDGYIDKPLSIGSLGFFMAFLAFLSYPWTWHKKFYFITIAIVLLIIVRTPVTEILYKFNIPIISTGTITRIIFIQTFAFSVLSAFGLEYLKNIKKSHYIFMFLCFLIISSLWIFLFLKPDISGIIYLQHSFRTMSKALTLPSAIFFSMIFFMVAIRNKIVLCSIFLVFACLELFYTFTKFNPFVPKSFIYPENTLISYLKKETGIDKTWGYGTARIEANLHTQIKLYSPDGYDPLNLRWYNEFIQSSVNGKLKNTFDRTTRNDAVINPGYGTEDLPNNLARLKILDALGVKYILDREENPKNSNTFSEKRFKYSWSGNGWTLYENLHAAPRFFLTHDIKPYSNIDDFNSKFFASTFNSKTSVLMEQKDFVNFPIVKAGNNKTDVLRFEPNVLKFSVHTDTPQLFYLSDTYDKGWNAYINTQQTTIYKVNYAFRGVYIPSGSSIVHFHYKPKSIMYGSILLIFGLIILTTLSYFHKANNA